MFIPNEILLHIVEFADSRTLDKLKCVNRMFYNYIENIFRSKIKRYQIDYKDPSNFIYIANETSISECKIGDAWNFKKIIELYMKFYYNEKISYIWKDIASFPVYPNMIYCNLYRNILKTFPIQPKMTHCKLFINNLETFPVQPQMQRCDLSGNKIKSFPVQPKMTHCNLYMNDLETFPVQPEMIYCNLGGNYPLSKIHDQPKMISLESNTKINYI